MSLHLSESGTICSKCSADHHSVRHSPASAADLTATETLRSQELHRASLTTTCPRSHLPPPAFLSWLRRGARFPDAPPTTPAGRSEPLQQPPTVDVSKRNPGFPDIRAALHAQNAPRLSKAAVTDKPGNLSVLAFRSSTPTIQQTRIQRTPRIHPTLAFNRSAMPRKPDTNTPTCADRAAKRWSSASPASTIHRLRLPARGCRDHQQYRSIKWE